MTLESLETADREAIEALVTSLEGAWNRADGEAFAAPFAPDADFVNIRAEHMRGRQAVAAGHTAILTTIYAGSVNRYVVDSARLLRSDVALVHVRSTLDCPTGPLAGTNTALFSLVLTREPEGWRIATFHNTLTPPAR